MADKIEIKKYIEDNRPDLLIEALGSTLPQVIKSIKSSYNCITTTSEILKETTCHDVRCHNCPFNKSVEEAKNWLRGK